MLIILYLLLVLIVIPLPLLLISIFQQLIISKNTNYFDVLNYLSIKLLNVKHVIVGENIHFIQRGIILSNHRSWFDFPFDNYITKACVISRNEVQWVMLFAGLLQVIENRVIRFSRGKTSREYLYNLIDKQLINNDRNILLYPEGTRCKHMVLSSLEDVKNTLKPGMLKSIYENKTYSVQIIISTNKEKCLNEKMFSISFGETIKTIIGKEIDPQNYNSFDEFYDAISLEWLQLWNKVY